MIRGGTLLFLVILAALARAADETKRPIPAVRAVTPPKIDGDLSDAAWTAAPLATGFYDRVNGGPAKDQTEVRILYDEKAVYLSFRMRDEQPDKVVGRETVRDSRFNRREHERRGQRGRPVRPL